MHLKPQLHIKKEMKISSHTNRQKKNHQTQSSKTRIAKAKRNKGKSATHLELKNLEYMLCVFGTCAAEVSIVVCL